MRSVRMKTKMLFGVSIWLSIFVVIMSFSYVPLASHKEISLPFLHSEKEKALIFFGFPACADVCPTTLYHLSRILKDISPLEEKPEVVFIDINPHDTKEVAQNYASYFNSEFIGYKPDEKELNRLIREFGLNIKRLGPDISHQGKTYLLEKQQNTWVLTKTFNPSEFTLDLLRSEFRKG